MNKCLLNLSLLLLLLPSSVLAHPSRQEAQCFLPGTVAISTAGLQPTAKLTICTAIPPHIRRYLSVPAWKSAIKAVSTVRINDRGPYIGARELDLSYGAARSNRTDTPWS